MSDSIADMLTRIRNALRARHETTDMGHSKLKVEVARVLKREGYLMDYVVEGGQKKILRLYLKYAKDGTPAIRGLRRISKPGLRIYSGSKQIPRTLGGLGIVILTAPRGVMSGRDAKKQNTGGEVLCEVW